ncbi:N-terminal methylation [hydrothermal vent metagenome]|uniref:N-terminal methylation n=1 Tax=hydrothermal vent metagenome TaxID=652676 RepID=A0A1W1BVL2_9ZZZZ
MKKTAFTMIELVFVIVVLAIIASLAMERMDRDLKQEASETILSHIRLAQQLALNDNKHRKNNNGLWQRAYWRFEYGKCRNTTNLDGTAEYYYRVGSATTLDSGFNKNESAINPMDGKYLYTMNKCNNLQNDESPTVLISKKFGINRIRKYGGCSTVQHIAFDYLGRPHHQIASYGSADFSKIMTRDCRLKFEMSTDTNNDGIINEEDSFIITIEAETGHAFIVGQENL